MSEKKRNREVRSLYRKHFGENEDFAEKPQDSATYDRNEVAFFGGSYIQVGENQFVPVEA